MQDDNVLKGQKNVAFGLGVNAGSRGPKLTAEITIRRPRAINKEIISGKSTNTGPGLLQPHKNPRLSLEVRAGGGGAK